MFDSDTRYIIDGWLNLRPFWIVWEGFVLYMISLLKTNVYMSTKISPLMHAIFDRARSRCIADGC
jgi:hypothetical protein